MPRPKKQTPINSPIGAKLKPELEAMLAKLDPDEAKTVRAALMDDAAEKEVVKQMRSEQDRQNKEKHFWITLIRMPDDTEPFAFVGAAGVGYKLDKGVRMPVPESVINALRYAKVEGYIPVIDDAGNRKQKRVSYDRYPFQLDGECSLADAHKWKVEQQQKAKRRENVMESQPQEEEIEGRPQVEFGPVQTMGADEA